MPVGEHACPSCERTFDSRRGLGVHHKSVHDEHLPNQECAECGRAFFEEFEKKYCSADCLREAAPSSGQRSPNYRGAKTATACEICGDEFEYYPSDKKGLYCPSCVESENWHYQPEISGANNPRWKGGKVTKECVVCESPVTRYPSQFTSDVVTCGTECRGEWLSEAFTGDGHPNYVEGGNEDYGPGWAAVRERALERDNYACVHCGATREELGRNPDVHHLTPVRWFADSVDHGVADAHTLDNVVSLCIACHRKAEFGHLDPGALRDAAADASFD